MLPLPGLIALIWLIVAIPTYFFNRRLLSTQDGNDERIVNEISTAVTGAILWPVGLFIVVVFLVTGLLTQHRYR